MLRSIEPNQGPIPGTSTPYVMGKKGDVGGNLCGSSEFHQNTIDPAAGRNESLQDDYNCGPMAIKINLLKEQVSDLDDEISRRTKDGSAPTQNELGRIIERKAQIEKTLALLGGTTVQAVVKTGDSMDLGRKSSVYSESSDDNDEPDPPTTTGEPLRLFSMPDKQYSIDDIGALQSSRGRKERFSDRRANMLFPGVKGQSGSFHASDYLFMSSDSFNTPSCRNFSVTSRPSFRRSSNRGGPPPPPPGSAAGREEEVVGVSLQDELFVTYEEQPEGQAPQGADKKHGKRAAIAASFTSMFAGLGSEAAPQESSCFEDELDSNNGDSTMIDSAMIDMKRRGRTYSIG